jgi:hypothetical protein
MIWQELGESTIDRPYRAMPTAHPASFLDGFFGHLFLPLG